MINWFVIKWGTALFLLFAAITNVSAYSMEDFILHSPEEQVLLWLETYKNNPYYFTGLRFAQTVGYFTESENIAEYTAILIGSLRTTHILKGQNVPHDFSMIVSLLTDPSFFFCMTNQEKKM